MDKLSTLISLNEAKNNIDELIAKVKRSDNDTEQDNSGKLILMILALVGGLVVVGLIAYAVYRHFSEDYLDDYEDLDDIFEDEEDEDDELAEEEEDVDMDPEVLVSEDDFEE